MISEMPEYNIEVNVLAAFKKKPNLTVPDEWVLDKEAFLNSVKKSVDYFDDDKLNDASFFVEALFFYDVEEINDCNLFYLICGNNLLKEIAKNSDNVLLNAKFIK